MPWQEDLLDPLYEDEFMATDAVIVTVPGRRVGVRAIDKTAGIAVPTANGFDLQTLSPAATIRMSELLENGIDLEHVKSDVNRGQIELSEKRWRIGSIRFEPTAGGPVSTGEVYLMLSGEEPL